jgi:serine/threonine-protein kinase
VALEHYKTQVLLLHSKQSTLDALSTGFSDRYSVHCATSGSEALSTLGVTPIHVIVSAQDLPGMSGLEALREARKRSPDTIGILLAGRDQSDGLEALVGDKEVFQIVRGEITPEALRNLIDTATRSARLIALSESANDMAANVDVPMGEHIVMETSENGATIISDGTGTMPTLKPQKIQLGVDLGSRGIDILVLTKDDEFLSTVKDSARGLHKVLHAVTPNQAEAIFNDNKIGVLVTDAAMVGSNIEVLTQRMRAFVPRLVAIVAGRRDDGELLMDLINRGHVYRFLLKPVSPGRARLAIEASVKHHLEAPESAFKPVPGKAPPAPVAKPAAVVRPATVARPELEIKPQSRLRLSRNTYANPSPSQDPSPGRSPSQNRRSPQ